MSTVTRHDSLDRAIAADVAALWRRIDTELIGHADFITTAGELVSYTGIRAAEQQLLVTYADPELVGFAWAILPLADNANTLEAEIRLIPGADPAPLIDALRTLRPIIAVWHPAGLDLSPQGLQLVQVEVTSALQIPAHFPECAPDPSYALASWRGPVPDEHLSGLAALKELMSTDMPWGGQIHEKETWDAGRIRELEEAARRAGTEMLWSVAVHRGSGDHVGFTQLSCPAGRPRIAFQEDTLVAAAHRGHGLGMALKIANLGQLELAMPQVRTLYTWNAENNRYMLDINRRLGFVSSGTLECWQAG